jgi:hypothetical protein
MKNLFKVFSVAMFSATLLFTGCAEDKCKKVECGTNGTCLEGLCNCTSGYEGDKCETMSSTKFVGLYNQKDAVSCDSASYTVAITLSSIPTKVLVNNFGGSGTANTLSGTAAGSKITIDAGQTVTIPNAGVWTVTSGTALLTGTTLASTFKLTKVGAAVVIDCSATGTKR